MKIADFSVNRPVAISMLIIALVLVGLVSLPMLRVDLYPDMNLPIALIQADYEAAAPAEVENLVTKPLESVLSTVNNVKTLNSMSNPGSSMVIIEFNWGTDMDQAALDMRDKVDIIKGALPSEVRNPRVLKLDPNSFPIISYALSGPDQEELKRVSEDIVKPRLERVQGVASVTATGGKEKEIKVIVDPAKLQAYGLTAQALSQAIGMENIAGTAGSTSKGSNDQAIRVVGEYKTTTDLAELAIGLPGGGSVRLGDLATVEKDYKKVTQVSYINGQPSVGLDILKATGSNTVQVATRVKAGVEELQKELPPDMKIVMVQDLSKFISQSISSVVEHAVLGGLLAVLVLYMFLRSFRSTLVVAMVIPISIIGTFSMMYFGGQTINILSLGGLALGLGSLVDFSVVVLESIYRKRQEGLGITEAAKEGTSEVGNAVMASAMAQVVVFMPIVFVQGLAGILFGPLALTVSFSHLAALFAALTLVPMLASKLLRKVYVPSHEGDEELALSKVDAEGKCKVDAEVEGQGVVEGVMSLEKGQEKGEAFGKAPGEGIDGKLSKLVDRLHRPAEAFGRYFARLSKQYAGLLNWALGHRKRVVLITGGMLVGSLLLIPLVGTEFMPTMDQGQISISLEMPPGTRLEETSQTVSAIEGMLGEMPETETVYSRVGNGGQLAMMGGGSGEQATMQIKLKPLGERSISTAQMVDLLQEKVSHLPGAEITVKVSDEGGGPTGKAINIRVKGDDLAVLKDLGSIMKEEIAQVEGTRNITSNMEDARSELKVTIDRKKAGNYGISAGQVLSSVRTAFNGQVASRMRTGDDEIDIRLMYPEDYRLEPANLSGLMVNTATGAKVAVGDVATIKMEEAPATITRMNQARLLSLEADISGRDLGSINKDIEARLDKIPLPSGYIMESGGQAEEMAESFGSLFLALLLSIVLVYMVMAAQFESLFYPFVIMFSLPPTLVGVVLGLLITGHRISVAAMIGAIMLVGIVVNNAIVLIDYVNTLRKRGIERNEAIKRAGPIRLRPILMTTLSTVLALLPMAFLGGEGSEGSAPLAVVVAFGLTFSTLVTLVLVPVVYTLFDDLGLKIKGAYQRRYPTVENGVELEG